MTAASTFDADAIDRGARALIDISPTINGYHEMHMDLMRPRVRAVLEAVGCAPAVRGDSEPAAVLFVALDELRDAQDFYDRVRAAPLQERIAVGQDHHNRLDAAVRAVVAAPRPGADDAGRLVLPAEMTPEIKSVLSMMCFEFIHMARAYRAGGHTIAQAAEEEQAFFMWRYLKAIEARGTDWREVISDEIEAMRATARQVAATGDATDG